MTKQLTIHVAGTAASGKSTVARIIQRALAAEGIQAQVTDDDAERPGAFTSPWLEERIAGLKDAKLEVEICTTHVSAMMRPRLVGGTRA